jgi:hypothetical protein
MHTLVELTDATHDRCNMGENITLGTKVTQCNTSWNKSSVTKIWIWNNIFPNLEFSL